jgi:hypothetical protein
MNSALQKTGWRGACANWALALDQLDLVTVGILDERDHRRSAFDRARGAYDLPALRENRSAAGRSTSSGGMRRSAAHLPVQVCLYLKQEGPEILQAFLFLLLAAALHQAAFFRFFSSQPSTKATV